MASLLASEKPDTCVQGQSLHCHFAPCVLALNIIKCLKIDCSTRGVFDSMTLHCYLDYNSCVLVLNILKVLCLFGFFKIYCVALG